MGNRWRWAAGAVGAIGVLASSGARAQSVTETTTTTVRAVPPAPAEPPKQPIPQLDERTAFTVGKNTLKLGILAFEYGFVERASVGSDPPAWALRSFTSVLVPNLHVKVQLLRRDPVWIAVQGAAYYADISQNISGKILVAPQTLWASFKLHDRFYLHAEGAYIYVHAFGTGNVTRAELNGAAATQAVQTQLMAQLRLTRIFSLTALGRYQVWTGDVAFSGSSTLDPFTTASVNGQLTTPVNHPWEAIGGIAVLWKHFHMSLGAGYGYYFVPGLDVPNVKKTFVPDASLAVVF